MARTSKIYLAKNIKMDKNYKSVLGFSETQMMNLILEQNSSNQYVNLVYSDNNYSFIRDRGTIKVDCKYNIAIQSNYMAFQNPDYSNKYFFAFIDEVRYLSENSSEILYTIDVWTTWYDYWSPKACFVLREHVADDTFGSNTVPEDIETGEYICNSHYLDPTMDSYATDLCYVMASTSEPIAGEAKDTVAGSNIYNGIYTGLTYYEYETAGAIDIILELFAQNGKTDAINGIFMAPKWLAPLKSGTLYREVDPSNVPKTFSINITKQATLNGYTPVNNKTLCFPYNYLLVSNNIGQNAILHYEKFEGTMVNNAVFVVRGVLNPGCSINITPLYYNGNSSSDIDSIQLGKFPICNFQNDMYTNWLTQNSINILGQTVTTDDLSMASGVFGSIAGTIGSLATGNMLGATMSIAHGFNSIAQSSIQKKQHNMIPPTVSGQLNSADVNVASGKNTFHFYKMSVKYEFAQRIDQYFTRLGYAVNKVKVPNFTHRQNYNYIQIAGEDNVAYPNNHNNICLPATALNDINNLFRNGITIWNNHTNFGDYSVSNNITN